MAIIWDLEIALPVEEIPGGWDAVRRGEAGISCVCLYDTITERYHTYDQHTLVECMLHLNSADVLIGFNTKGFDTPVIESITGYSVNVDQYDILEEIWRALPSKTKGYKLKQLCERLDIGTKVVTGESAPTLFRTGQFGKLFDYCINDVHLTRKLARWINDNGYVLGPENEPIEVNPPGVDV
jgi:hypothetical protein